MGFAETSFDVGFMTGLIFFGVPTGVSWLAVHNIQQAKIRHRWWIAILVIQLLFFWVVFHAVRDRTIQV